MALIHGRADQLPRGYGRIWLMGGPGSGKTVAAATFPRPYFLNSHNEDSIKTLRGLPYPYTVLVPEPGRVRQDLTTFADTLLRAASQSVDHLHSQFGQTLVIDGWSHFNDVLVSEIADAEVKGSVKGKMDQPKWGLLLGFMLNFRDMLWRLPMHVIITSLVYTPSGDKGGLGGAAGQGQASERVPSSCDAIGYCTTNPQGVREVHFQQYGIYPARHRWGLQGLGPGPFPNHALWQVLAPFLGWST